MAISMCCLSGRVSYKGIPHLLETLLNHCVMLHKCESEAEKKKIKDFLTLNGNFD